MKVRHYFAGLLLMMVLASAVNWSMSPLSNTTKLVLSTYERLQKESEQAAFNNEFDRDYAASVSKTILSTYNGYLSLKDVNDSKIIANKAFSTQSLVLNQTEYRLGELIQVSIDLYDGYGKHMTYGGDILRIWLTDPLQQASVNGYVKDHGNGSYTGYLMGLWTGKCIIKTSIANTKEHISLVQKHIEKHGQLYAMLGGFGKNKVVEKTTCSVKPDVYGLRDMCNLTTDNHDYHWYCGRPTHPNVTCLDWETMHDVRTHNINSTKVGFIRPYNHQLLKNSPTIRIMGNHDIVGSPDLPCYKRPYKDTWTEESPVGFFHHNKWNLRGCRITFVPSRTSYEKCLRGQYLLFIGDSNIRSWFWQIEKIIELSKNMNTEILTPMKAERTDLNLTMQWGCHEMPFYSAEPGFPRKNIQSVAWHLDEVPRLRKVIVVIHYAYHFFRVIPTEFRAHIRNAKLAIVRLFKRNPEAKVFIRGAHSITYPGNFDAVDYLRNIHEQILYEEMLELHDKIVFLNEWDLTTCIGNVNIHPSEKTVMDMLHSFMGYLCEN